MNAFFSLFAVVFIFGLVVFIHEFGHFITARLSGVTVLEFSLGMGPRLFSKDYKGTKYSLKLLPIGGSCMMLGEDEENPDPGAFNNAKPWKRFLILFAGAGMNLFLAGFAGILLCALNGVDLPVASYVQPEHPASEVLRTGDEILSINGQDIVLGKDLSLITQTGGIPDTVNVTFLRDGEEMSGTYESTYEDLLLGFSYNLSGSGIVVGVTEGSGAEAAGITTDDTIIAVDGTTVEDGEAIREYFDGHSLSEGTPIVLTLMSDSGVREVSVEPSITEVTSFGFSTGPRVHAGFFATFYGGIQEAVWWVKSTFLSLGMLLTGQAGISDLTGPVGISTTIAGTVYTSARAGIGSAVSSILMLIILVSANLGIMNLLPVPALDGGRIVFVLIEMVRRKPVPAKVEGMVHGVGLLLLMVLMLVVFLQDAFRLMTGWFWR